VPGGGSEVESRGVLGLVARGGARGNTSGWPWAPGREVTPRWGGQG